LHQNHIIKVRFDIPAVSEYALYWLLSPGGRDRIMQVTSSTSGLYTLSLSKVASLMLPLAPLPEQHRIVARIQALCAEADAGEAAVKVARRRLAALDGAVLARAFRGEL
jgi:type I restriction enzyme S subunit